MRVAPERWKIAACLAVLALALVVAAAIAREPVDFSALPLLALVRDRQQHPLWSIRVAAAAHLIAVEAVTAPPLPDERAYQLWLSGPNGVRSLGLLPEAGRRIIPEMPALIARLEAGNGKLDVTLEPAHGSITGQPSGPVMFRSALAGSPGR
jgi:anti-sigma-K factor RskA